ncbi:hypothetical protein V6N13_082334 [Hibiscus sabdariffa]|uniref:Uncharacterized protein n=1 Tax=Hibiscus sabdariffa TaxID=183260 RepID=A0ABR2Q336_9ROSI
MVDSGSDSTYSEGDYNRDSIDEVDRVKEKWSGNIEIDKRLDSAVMEARFKENMEVSYEISSDEYVALIERPMELEHTKTYMIEFDMATNQHVHVMAISTGNDQEHLIDKSDPVAR